MSEYFESLESAVVDRSPDELVAAIVIALALALAFAGVSLVGRRNVRNALMPMIALMLVANLASMAVGAGYLLHVDRQLGYLQKNNNQNAPNGSDPMLVDTIFRAADKNEDGLLSGEEASLAAAEFVRKVDANGKGLIDVRSLEHALPAAGFRGRSPVGHPYPPYFGSSPPFRQHPGRPTDVPTPPPGPPPADEMDDSLPPSDATSRSDDPGHEPGSPIE
jgi:hypothetical protein